MVALAEGTAKAFIAHFVDVALSLHGLGPVVKVVKWVSRIRQWSQVVDGRGELEVHAPIPLGPGLELDLSARVADSADDGQPPLTCCFAPSGDSPVGVLTFGPFQVIPSSDRAGNDHSSSESSDRVSQIHLPGRAETHLKARVECQGPVVVLRQDLSGVMRVDGSQARVARLHEWAANSLAPVLADNLWLRLADADLVIVYDPDTAVAMWVHLGAVNRSSWRVTIRPHSHGYEDAKIAVSVADRR
jgi:hypothetical protein